MLLCEQTRRCVSLSNVRRIRTGPAVLQTRNHRQELPARTFNHDAFKSVPQAVLTRTSSMRSSSSANQTLKVVAISCVCLLAACSSNSSKKPGEDQPYGVVVVNAPAAGEVRRILVSEGAQVSAGTPIVEIAVQNQTQT